MTEIVETDLVPYTPPPPVTLFGTDDPAAVIAAAKRTAEPLVDVIRSQKLSVKIGPSEHVRVEGWTLLGSMLGVFASTLWTRKIEGDDGGWEARVEARTRAGDLVGAAEAECLRSEKTWASRDDYALRSMAQTRATSKALRQPLGFVMQLAGFNPTPAEEMPVEPKAKDKAPAMRTRIKELAVQADEVRGKTHPEGRKDGETEAEVHAAFKALGTTLAKANGEELAEIGKGLAVWIEDGCDGPYSATPF